MSCNACTKRYGFFCKESGCPNCGYSFCTKCLKKVIEVPRRNGAKLNVCLKCYEKLEREKQQLMSHGKPGTGPISTAELLALDVPQEVDLAPPIEPIHLGDEAKPDEDSEIANNLDSVLSKRLQGLKEDDANDAKMPLDTDMASRLAALKGVPYKEYSKADLLVNKDTRTDKEKIDDLIKQFVDETDIDQQAQPSNPLQEIERRLAALKGENSAKVDIKIPSANVEGTSTPSDNDDEEVAASKVLKKYLEEAKLPEPPTTAEEQEFIAGLPPPSKDTEELPWCTICNEDAIIRCLGCDGDLFCRNCYRECHDDEDFREHKSEPYSKPPTFKEDHF